MSGTERQQRHEAAQSELQHEVNLSRLLNTVIPTFVEELAAAQAHPSWNAKVAAVWESLRDTYFHTLQPTFDYQLVAANLHRITLIVKETLLCKRRTRANDALAVEVMGLAFEVVLLSIALPTPGLVGLWKRPDWHRAGAHVLDDALGELVSWLVLAADIRTADARPFSRTHGSTSSAATPRRQRTHPGVVDCWVKIQGGGCALPHCDLPPDRDPAQTKKGNPSFVSVQQKLPRGLVDVPGPNLDVSRHMSFPCLVDLGEFGFNKVITVVCCWYARETHGRKRHVTGKGSRGESFARCTKRQVASV